jgi:hypothetical protein
MSPKVSYPTFRFLLILLSLGVVCCAARAQPITINQPFDDPFEGNDGRLLFTVTNVVDVNVTIDFVRLAPPPPSFEFLFGEMADEVNGAMISPIGNTCIGVPKVVLAPRRTCSFTELVGTIDRSPYSDVDIDTWEVLNQVGYISAQRNNLL